MTRQRIDLGKRGEALALKKIESLGYRCIARNYRCPLGEIDLIARDGDTLVFLEIKTRMGKSIGYAKEAVNARKKRQLSKAALTFMKAQNCCDAKSRFDIVAISIQGDVAHVEVVKDAFELAYG